MQIVVCTYCSKSQEWKEQENCQYCGKHLSPGVVEIQLRLIKHNPEVVAKEGANRHGVMF